MITYICIIIIQHASILNRRSTFERATKNYFKTIKTHYYDNENQIVNTNVRPIGIIGILNAIKIQDAIKITQPIAIFVPSAIFFFSSAQHAVKPTTLTLKNAEFSDSEKGLFAM